MKKLTAKLFFAAALAAAPLAATAETVLKVGTVIPEGTPWGSWLEKVAAKIEADSNGELRLDLLLGGSVGDEQTILRQTAKGRIDIAVVSNVPLTLLAEDMALPSAAYLFEDIEQGTCVANGHLNPILDNIMKEAGVVPISWWEAGNYAIFSKDPVVVPSDLNGKKVRIAPSIADAAFARELGTSGIPLGTSDTIPALQTGNVDAAFFPTVYGIAIGTHKVAPNVIYSKHTRLFGSTALSQRTAAKLSEQEMEWLTAFEELAPELTTAILGAEQALLAKIADAGISVVHPDEAQMGEWRASATGVMPALIDQIGGKSADIAAALEAAKVACNG